MMYLGFLFGLGLLLLGGDLLVRGASRIAESLGVPHLIIGLSIVAFATSAPEFFTSLSAALEGREDIALGNVVGSNIANILLVLGLPALFCAVPCGRPLTLANGCIMLAASLLLVLFCLYGALPRPAGFLLFACAMAVTLYWIAEARRGRITLEEENAGGKRNGLLLASAQILGAVVGLSLGAHLLVENGAAMARHLGVSEAVIAVSLIAVGTSLPEIAATTIAAARKHMELALGNALGSNIFNVFFVLGSVASIRPLEVSAHFLRLDLWVMLAASLIVFPFLLTGTAIGRSAGCGFLLCYAGFLAFLTLQP